MQIDEGVTLQQGGHVIGAAWRRYIHQYVSVTVASQICPAP